MPDADTPHVKAPARIAAFAAGVAAEARCADHLRARGFVILAARYKTPSGEIDLVARKDDLIAFVEVKARARLDDAAWAVTPRQQRRIIAAAEAWLAANPDAAGCELRFDVMMVASNRALRHLAAAFDAST